MIRNNYYNIIHSIMAIKLSTNFANYMGATKFTQINPQQKIQRPRYIKTTIALRHAIYFILIEMNLINYLDYLYI